jgi:hypothetical protein
MAHRGIDHSHVRLVETRRDTTKLPMTQSQSWFSLEVAYQLCPGVWQGRIELLILVVHQGICH